jgi:hypothetical protein
MEFPGSDTMRLKESAEEGEVFKATTSPSDGVKKSE